MNDNKKKIIWTAALVAAILLIGLGIWAARRHAKVASESRNQESSLTDVLGNPNASLPDASTSASSQTSAKQPSKAYTSAVETYQYRIQFTQCHGIVNLTGSGTLAVRKGSKIMLDNRDPVAHTIAFKGTSVKVGAENFSIVTANTVGTYPVTCDGGGAATLKVE